MRKKGYCTSNFALFRESFDFLNSFAATTLLLPRLPILMRLRPTWKSLLAFVALLFFVGEAHELVHTGLGRLLCGCWGARDFNGWSLCANYQTGHVWTNFAATYAGN